MYEMRGFGRMPSTTSKQSFRPHALQTSACPRRHLSCRRSYQPSIRGTNVVVAAAATTSRQGSACASSSPPPPLLTHCRSQHVFSSSLRFRCSGRNSASSRIPAAAATTSARGGGWESAPSSPLSPSPAFQLPPVHLEYDPARLEDLLRYCMPPGAVTAVGFDLEWRPMGHFGGTGGLSHLRGTWTWSICLI